MFRAATYEEFKQALEMGPHLALPFIINGDYSVPTAPQGMRANIRAGTLWLPIPQTQFSLHHAQLDRLWGKWQHMGPERRLTEYAGRAVVDSRKKAASLGDVMDFGDLGPSVKVEEIMDTTAGPLWYRY
ncbi:hypothetical protein MMC27_001205 [Xylographa pallens]|nr:hypothetical protein [Xylographa pallens]